MKSFVGLTRNILGLVLIACVLSSFTKVEAADTSAWHKDFSTDEIKSYEANKIPAILTAADGTYDPVRSIEVAEENNVRFAKTIGSVYFRSKSVIPTITENTIVFSANIKSNHPYVKITARPTTTSISIAYNLPSDKLMDKNNNWVNVVAVFSKNAGSYTLIVDGITVAGPTQSNYVKDMFAANGISYMQLSNTYTSGTKDRVLCLKDINLLGIAENRIVETMPADQDIWAAVGNNITVVTEKIINSSSVSLNDKITLKVKDGRSIPLSEFLVNDKTLTLKAESPLEYDTDYILSIGGLYGDYSIEMPVSSIAFRTRIENPVPSRMEISGNKRIVIPRKGEAPVSDASYTVNVYNSRDNKNGLVQMADWSLAQQYEGISIHNKTGALQIRDNAKSGLITIVAAAGAVIAQYEIYLDDIDLSGLIAYKNKAETILQGIIAEGVVYDAQLFGHLQEACVNAGILIEGSDRTQEDVNNLCSQFKNVIDALLISAYGVPTVRNVVISGDAIVGSPCTASGEFLLNGSLIPQNMQTASNYIWKRANALDGEFTAITGAAQESYLFTESDIDKYVKVSVVPCYKKFDHVIQGQAVDAQAKAGPSLPIASAVTIHGKNNPGETLSGTYKYYHKHGFSDTNSVYRWLDVGQSPYAVLSTSKTYELQDRDIGKEIALEITPVTEKSPTNGLPVLSETVEVVKLSISGGSGGGGGHRVITNSIPQVNNEIIPPVSNGDDGNGTSSDNNLFNDISDSWAKDIIEKLAKSGYISGVGEKHFMPDNAIKRSEFIAIIARIINDTSVYKDEFSDVKKDDWYSGFVATALKYNIIQGSNAGFQPDAFITREEMTKIVVETYRALKNVSVEDNNSGRIFLDYNDISDWAKKYVNYSYSIGLVSGIGDGSFAPASFATRAHAAALISRLIGKLDQ